jgi:sensor histidine kinase YesM
MKKLFTSLQLSPGFLTFIVSFAYLDSIRSRLSPGQTLNSYIFTPESAITAIPFFLVIVILLRFYFQKIHGENFPIQWPKAILSFVLGLFTWNGIVLLFSYSVSLIFGTVDRNFKIDVLISSTFTHSLDFIIYGGFYFAYLLYVKFKDHQRLLDKYEQVIADSTIAKLKQQLDPHFLFNNLNVLDQLIDEDPKVASSFLQDFSEIYRYVLEKSDQGLVELKDELAFAQNYFNLLGHKFGTGYQLQISAPETNTSMIPPLSLQLLIENAVFHNRGSAQDPLTIRIEVQDEIMVSNPIRPYKYQKHRGGRGLKNLKNQFELLNKGGMKVQTSSETFTVVLPLIPFQQP